MAIQPRALRNGDYVTVDGYEGFWRVTDNVLADTGDVSQVYLEELWVTTRGEARSGILRMIQPSDAVHLVDDLAPLERQQDTLEMQLRVVRFMISRTMTRTRPTQHEEPNLSSMEVLGADRARRGSWSSTFIPPSSRGQVRGGFVRDDFVALTALEAMERHTITPQPRSGEEALRLDPREVRGTLENVQFPDIEAGIAAAMAAGWCEPIKVDGAAQQVPEEQVPVANNENARKIKIRKRSLEANDESDEDTDG